MLINAVERSDPHGWPGFWDVAHQAHVYPAPLLSEVRGEPLEGRSTAIGWHPADRSFGGALDHEATDYGSSLKGHWS